VPQTQVQLCASQHTGIQLIDANQMYMNAHNPETESASDGLGGVRRGTGM